MQTLFLRILFYQYTKYKKDCLKILFKIKQKQNVLIYTFLNI